MIRQLHLQRLVRTGHSSTMFRQLLLHLIDRHCRQNSTMYGLSQWQCSLNITAQRVAGNLANKECLHASNILRPIQLKCEVCFETFFVCLAAALLSVQQSCVDITIAADRTWL